MMTIRIGFGTGTRQFMKSFDGTYHSSRQVAKMLYGDDTCSGYILTAASTADRISFWGDIESPEIAHHIVFRAEATPLIVGYSIKSKLVDVREGKKYIRTYRLVTIKYNPAITGTAWKEVYGILFQLIRLEYHRRNQVKMPLLPYYATE